MSAPSPLILDERCSEVSRRVGESLFATAPFVEAWLLVEVPAAWPRDVSDGAALPAAVRRGIADWLDRTQRSKLLFVRRPGRGAAQPIAFIVHCREREAEARRVDLERLDDLGAGEFDSVGERTDAPLVLVCGHGSRDRCCALQGTAVFSALAPELGDEQLWISSHQGGHRFAGNVLLPESGVHLGRLDPGNAVRVVERALESRIDLGHYRGRTCFEPLVQAAEHAARSEAALEEIGDLRLAGVEAGTVRFVDATGVEHIVEVEESPGVVVPASCGAAPEPQPAFTARVL